MSKPNARAEKVQSFFDESEVAGLRLPNGWFGGRAMEGHHCLTLVVDRPHHLIIELDSQVLLIFSGEAVVEVGRSTLAMESGTPTLSVSGFSQFVFDRLGYGDMLPHVEVFHEGVVQFVAPV